MSTQVWYQRSRGGLETLISVLGDGWTVHSRARTGPRGHTVWDFSGNNYSAGPMLSMVGYGRVSPRGDVTIERAKTGDYRDERPVDPDVFAEHLGSWLDVLVPLWTARRKPPEGMYPFPEHPSPPFADEAAEIKRNAPIVPLSRRRRPRANPTARVAPPAVRAAAQRGLDLYRAGHRCCTAVGLARARQLAGGRPVSDRDVVAMNAYFARHAVDRRPGWERRVTRGYLAWLMWGGDAGRAWAARERARLR